MQKVLTVYCNLMCDLSVCLRNFHSLEMNPWSICPVANLRGIAMKLLEKRGRLLERSLLHLCIVWFSHFEMDSMSLTNSIGE